MTREQTGARRRRGGQPSDQGATAAGTASATSEQTRDANGRAGAPSVSEALRNLVVRSIMMYALYHYYIKPKTQQGEPDIIESIPAKTPADTPPNALASMLGVQTGPVPGYYKVKLANAWEPGVPLQLRVFTSLDSEMHFRRALESSENAWWSLEDFSLSTAERNYFAKNLTLPVPPVVRNSNGTWYAHIFVVGGNLFQRTPDTVTDDMIDKYVLYGRHEFVTWFKVDLKKQGKSLLGTEEEESSENAAEKSSTADETQSDGEGKSGDEEENQIEVRYDQRWKPTLPISLVVVSGALKLGELPQPAAEKFRVSTSSRVYYPPMEVNEFWMLRDTLPAMNETVAEVTVEVSLTPMSLYKWSMYKQFDNVWQRQIDMGVMRPEEKDDLKRIFIETNPVLLATTSFVSLAHTVLEALAFKNDITHWKNIKTMEGVSVRSMIWKIVMEAIIFLYLWDNDTSWLITIGNGFGLGIAIWKLGKAVKFENFGKRKLLGFIPWFEISDRESYSKETKEYDDQAMKYLGYALYPLVACYALYSLKYEKHKSWYSWVISSLVGAVYAFGFIMMFPQIFINYKLKSVAHMPMKAMMYKTLNTIIDDLFSFIIKMPWLHRVACFRDDVVFLIILYQRWIYPVDKTRVNEFGQQFDENGEEKVESTKDDAKRSAPAPEADASEVKPAQEKKND